MRSAAGGRSFGATRDEEIGQFFGVGQLLAQPGGALGDLVLESFEAFDGAASLRAGRLAVIEDMAGSAVSASVGRAGSVGGLAVPPTWAAATPAIRTVSAVLSGAAQGGVPAAAVSQGSLFSATALAGAAGGALGAAVPRAAAGAGASRRGVSVEGRKELKDSDSPQNLQRLVAEMADKPENVRHWHTDAEHLDGLLAELRHKPGTHAVHVSNGAKPKATPPKSRPI
jgi:hypothetical protein